MNVFEVPLEQRAALKPLAAGWEEAMILSCLQGHMGRAFVDSLDAPRSAQLLVGDFCVFLGEPVQELVRNCGAVKEGFTILVPDRADWETLIEDTYPNSRKITRYAIKKERDVFQRERLEKIVDGLPPCYTLVLIDEGLYHKTQEEDWSRDLCSQFAGAEDFCRRGLGVAVLHGEQLVSGASSYAVYDNGIEIEIDTQEDYRRQGLASAAGAKLILTCLDRGMYPSWDAHDLRSVALAEKLGYHMDHAYTAYEVMLSITE